MQSDPFASESDRSVALKSDLELLNAIADGQVGALGALYDRYAKLVYGLAWRILENAEEAEDLTQDVFLMVWQRQTYDPRRGTLSSFLTTLTRSRAIDRLRARRSRWNLLQRWQGIAKTESVSSPPIEQVSVNERSQQVRNALLQLPEQERQVLEIAYYEGLSQSEIAQRLNTPLGTVKTRSRQGLRKLRELLQDYI